MTSKRILQYSMALPILVPLFAMSLFLLGVIPQKGLIGGIFGIVVYSGIIGGVPYVILGLLISFWMIDKPLRSIRKLLLVSPILMVAIFAICYAILNTISFGRMPTFDFLSRRIPEMLSLSIFILIFGYLYVGIAFGLVRLFGTDAATEDSIQRTRPDSSVPL